VRGIVVVDPNGREAFDAFRTAGFDAFLVRPIRPAALLGQIGLRESVPPTRTVTKSDGRARDAGSAVSHRVLLAEDNDVNALLARRMLERRGCEVVLVANGRTAIAAIETTLTGATPAFDLVLMDVHMPVMDGFEATAAIKALLGRSGAARRAPPIIALTANAFPEDRRRCLDAGMDDYLAKPFDQVALDVMLAKWPPPVDDAA
jgi:CheY-like chemotaxis protein